MKFSARHCRPNPHIARIDKRRGGSARSKTNLKNSVLLALVEGMAVQPIRIQDLKVSCFCLFLSDIELFLIEGKTNCNCKDRF